jgi:hypothetical protein
MGVLFSVPIVVAALGYFVDIYDSSSSASYASRVSEPSVSMDRSFSTRAFFF